VGQRIPVSGRHSIAPVSGIHTDTSCDLAVTIIQPAVHAHQYHHSSLRTDSLLSTGLYIKNMNFTATPSLRTGLVVTPWLGRRTFVINRLRVQLPAVRCRVSTWMGDRLRPDKPSRYVTSHLGQHYSAFHPFGVGIEHQHQPVWLGLRRGVFTCVG